MSHPPTPPAVPPGGTDRALPKEVRYFTGGFVFRKFTLKEQFLIACGYSVALEIHIATEHKPGVTRPLVEFNLTTAKTLEAAKNDLGKKAREKRAASLRDLQANPKVGATPIPFPKEK